MSGKLGSAELAAGVMTAVATMPSSIKSATLNYRIINPTEVAADVEVFIGANSTPQQKDRVEPVVRLSALVGVLESSAFVASPNEIVHVKSSVSGVIVRVHGHTVE